MELKAGYKQTEVGAIPDDWALQPLRQISPRQSVGLVINPSTYYDSAGTVPLLVGSNVAENAIDAASASRISEASNDLLTASRLSAGDIVMVRVGEPGVSAVVPPALDGCNCASMMIVRKHGSYNSNWLCAAMNSSIGRRQVEGVQYGTAQKQFNISDAVDFVFPVPPLPEQTAIANALSDVDALLAAQDALIAKKRAIKQGAMQELLTGKRRLPGFVGEWGVTSLGEVSRIRNQKIATHQVDADTLCIELENVGQGTGRLETRSRAGHAVSTKYTFQAGDVLFGRLRSYLRKYWLATEPGLCTTEIWPLAVDTKRMDPGYLFALVQTDAFIESASIAFGTHMPRADWGVIRNFEIQLPSIDEQTAIAEVLSDMDAKIASLETQRAKTAQLKQGMMQALLTGRIRLI